MKTIKIGVGQKEIDTEFGTMTVYVIRVGKLRASVTRKQDVAEALKRMALYYLSELR